MSARGIDIPNVGYVVNYDLPEQTENYVHRVGRTGRGKNRGFAVSFCSEGEKPLLKEIQGFIGKKIEVLDIDRTDYTDTVDLSEASDYDWKSLIEEAENAPKSKRKKKKR